MAAIVELACITGRISQWALLFFGGGVARRLGYMYLSDDSTSDYPLAGSEINFLIRAITGDQV